MKHLPIPTANATAATAAVLYIVCRIAVYLFPDLATTLAQSWFHGVAVNNVTGWSLSLESFIIGLLTLTVGAWLVGYLFASFYNKFAKK